MNPGMAIAGYGAAQPQIQVIQDMMRKKQEQAAIAQALQQYVGRQQGAGAPAFAGQPAPVAASGGPAGTPSPGGMPPGMNPNASGGAPSAGGGPAQAPGVTAPPPPAGGGFTGGMPDLGTMMGLLSKSGMSPDQQFEALTQYGAFASPFEKMLNQMEMKQTQLSNSATMLDARLQEMRDIAALNTGSRETIADKNIQSRENIADKNRGQRYSQMDAGALAKEFNTINTRLDTDLNLSAADRASLEQEWAAAKQALDDKRGGYDMPPSSTKMPKSKAGAAPAAKEKIKAGEEVRYDDKGAAYVNRNGQAVPAEQ